MANNVMNSPGNMVVPLSEIIDKLQGKLSAADLNALLLSIVSEQNTNVRPGDLITAEFVNNLLSDLEQLNLSIGDLTNRVTTLENSNPAQDELQILYIDGPSPIRVGSRVTVVGVNFSEPGSMNIVTVDNTPAYPLDNASTLNHLVLDMPNPGIGQTGRLVTLKVVNSKNDNATFQFQLEPILTIPTGDLAVSYGTPPAGGENLSTGPYDFGFLLVANVDQDSYVQVAATSDTQNWPVQIIDPAGILDFSRPIKLEKGNSTRFEINFNVRVIVPGAGTAAVTISAIETTSGSHVTPALEHVLNLTVGQKIPVPEDRVSIKFLDTSSNVEFEGGTAIFPRNVTGRINLDVLISNLGTANGVVTSFHLEFSLTDGNTNWVKGVQTVDTLDIHGPDGTGSVGIRITSPNATSSTNLLFTISGSPSVGEPINATYRIPLRTN